MKKKKILRSLLAVLLILCVTALPVFALTGTVVTQGSSLKIRKGPGTGYEEAFKLSPGDSVTILGEFKSDKGDIEKYPIWYKIAYETKSGQVLEGYAAANYITVDGTPDPVPGGEIDIYAYPEAYRPYLKSLAEAHPNWKFTFFDTGLDWNTVMDNECYRGQPFRNVVSASTFKKHPEYCYKDANGNYPISSEGWYQASDAVVAYYMDPRNLMTESRIFQFEVLSYDSSRHTVKSVEAILANSFMANKKITADDGRSITYAQAIYEAGVETGVSPDFLATKIIQEVGRNGSGSTSGTYIAKDGTNCSGYYNFYNIQATGKDGDPVKDGLLWASKTNSNESKNYGRPWTSPYKSIMGGAKYIEKGYIGSGQDSLYLQKFDVDSSDGRLYWHQYMANVMGATSESGILYKGYVNNNMLANDFVFAIPLYDNLPAERSRLPGDTSVDPAPIPDPKPVDPNPPVDPDPPVDPNPPVDPDPPKCGDVNEDGTINAVDARWALQAASGARQLTESQKKQADANGDGNINAVDARWILQAASGARKLEA